MPWFELWKNIFNGNNTKEEFLPNIVNDKINNNNITIKNIKNNIYNQVKTIINQLKVSNSIIIALRNALPPTVTTPITTTPPNNLPIKSHQILYNNVNTGHAYLDGYNSTMYENYNLHNCPSNTFGCINNTYNNTAPAPTTYNNTATAPTTYNNTAPAPTQATNKENEDNINKLITFNEDYIKLVLTSLEDNIYNMHQNIFDLEGKDDTQVEINTYHLEMLIYTKFLFKKLEKNVSNPNELNIMLINILKKINEQSS